MLIERAFIWKTGHKLTSYYEGTKYEVEKKTKVGKLDGNVQINSAF
jgi:hypothetical protein